MSKHSPGPWEWVVNEDKFEGGYHGLITKNTGRWVITGFGEGITQLVDVDDADARLIAAAPRLLDTLKAALFMRNKDLRNREEPLTSEWKALIREIEGPDATD